MSKKFIPLALALVTFGAAAIAPALAATHHPAARHKAAKQPAAKTLYNSSTAPASPSAQMPIGGPGAPDFNNQAWPGGEPGGGLK